YLPVIAHSENEKDSQLVATLPSAWRLFFPRCRCAATEADLSSKALRDSLRRANGLVTLHGGAIPTPRLTQVLAPANNLGGRPKCRLLSSLCIPRTGHGSAAVGDRRNTSE